MFRMTSIFLCVLFLSAVAGRYSAEESVRAAREELLRLDTEYLEESRHLQMLRAEIAYLESPERLAKVARSATDLRPPAQEEIFTARQFKAAMRGDDDTPDIAPPALNGAVIANAIAMADTPSVDEASQ